MICKAGLITYWPSLQCLYVLLNNYTTLKLGKSLLQLLKYIDPLKVPLIKFFSGIINMYGSTFGVDVFENFLKIIYERAK